MPDVPFIDTHVHFWDHSVAGLRWSWLDGGNTSGVARTSIDAARFVVPDRLAEASGTGLVGVVHGHCVHPVDDLVAETQWLDGLADEYGMPQALVGGCPLGDPDAPVIVRRHAAVGRLRGLRDPGSARDVGVPAAGERQG